MKHKSPFSLREFRDVKDRHKALEQRLSLRLPHIASYSLDDVIASTRNCENMIGVVQVPMGIAGPLRIKDLKLNSKNFYLPLATTEGALIASVSRGCKAIVTSGGATVNSHRIGTTRGPVFYTGGIAQNQKFYEWLKTHGKDLAKISEATSNHLVYKKYDITSVGTYVYVRFYFDTQDAMGMNMVTIATQAIVELIEKQTGVRCVSLSGNFCVDKKAAWQNMLNKRGIKAWAEVVIPEMVLTKTLKTSARKMQALWQVKCMLGSALSGSMGNNAQAANVIAALFLATGQDLGHVVEGSLAVTTIETIKSQFKGDDGLYVSVYLPDLMVGTVGGGTGLATQQEALKILDVAGGNGGKNALKFAEIVAAAVLAGEISLLASLAEGSLAKAHQRLGRRGK